MQGYFSPLAQQNYASTVTSSCPHKDCPMCRAEKESEELAKEVKNKEYKARCEKYLKEWKEKKK